MMAPGAQGRYARTFEHMRLAVIEQPYHTARIHLLASLLAVLGIASLDANAAQNTSEAKLLRVIQQLEARIEKLEARSAIEIENGPAIDQTPILRSDEPPEKPQLLDTSQTVPELEPAQPVKELVNARTEVSAARGSWHLYLNIDAQDKDQKIQPIVWQNVSQSFSVLDESGQPQLLVVDITMSGHGERIQSGRSWLRQPYFDYDFRFVVQYELTVDNDVVLSSEKFLSSEVLAVNRTGQISNRLMYDPGSINTLTVPGLPLTVQFGCTASDYQVSNNLDVADRAMADINQYACVRLDFAD